MVIVIKRKHWVYMMCALLLLPGMLFGYGFVHNQVMTTSADATNWGLSFDDDKKGTPPKGNKEPDYLKTYNTYFLGDNTEKKIYLTFDCGYENGYTPRILDVLKEEKVKATFFVVGNYVKTSSDLLKRMIKEGHTVGNHTFHHPNMSKISKEENFKKELDSLEREFEESTGQRMCKYYRPPCGKFNESNLRMAKDLGYSTFFWSLAYVDWLKDKQPTHEEAKEKLSRVHPGAVVLLHNTSKTNSEVLSDIIKQWKSEGYCFGELKEFLEA